MPGYSKNRNDGQRWGSSGRYGGQKPKRDDRNRNHDQRRPVMSPWESGVTPGIGASLLGNYHNQASTSAFLLGAAIARGEYNAPQNFNTYGTGNKMRRLDRMGGFDDQRGRGLLPSPPNAPLLGLTPNSFSTQSRGSESLQHRLGAPWSSSVQSSTSKGLGSAYYPSKGRQDISSRRIVKPKRSRPSNSSSSSRSGIRDARDKLKSSSSNRRSSKDREQDSKESRPKESEGDPSLKSESKEEERDQGEDDDKEERTEKEDFMEMEEKEKATEEEKAGPETKSDDKKDSHSRGEKRKLEDSFPAEALYCHICDLANFATKKGYIRHLEGITHSNMAETFHGKNAATLELLNISAKFAQMRRRDKLIRKSGRKGLPLGKIVESSLVENFLHPGSCCGEPFDSPYELEEHKLTIQHLLNVYEKKKEKEKNSEAQKVDQEEVEENLDTKIAEAKNKAADEPLTVKNIPSYDCSSPFGLEYMEKRPLYFCSMCRGESFKSVEAHCLSHKHYDNIVHYINKQEERNLEEKIELEKKEEEAEKERAKEEEERKKIEEREKMEEKSKSDNVNTIQIDQGLR